jgi:hypothetical protein
MFNQCVVETLCNTVLLRQVMDSELTFDTLIFQVSVELCAKILSASIRVEPFYLCSWGLASQFHFIVFESRKSLAFQLLEVDLHFSAKVIGEADVVEVSVMLSA